MDTIKIGLLIEAELLHGTDYVTVRVMGRINDQDHPINLVRDLGQDIELDGLMMRGHIYMLRDGGARLIGYEPEYRDVYAVNQRKAALMSKTLLKVERACLKANATEPGDVFMALAKAIGASFAIHRVGDRVASMMSEDRWRFMSLTEGRNYYRSLIEKMCHEANARHGAQAA